MNNSHEISQNIFMFAGVVVLPLLIMGLYWLMLFRWGPLLLQKLTGWDEAAKKYPVRTKFEGDWLSLQTIYPGPGEIGFAQWVDLAVTPQSLYIYWSSNILEIPISAIESIEECKRLWTTCYLLIIKDAPPLRFRKTKKLSQYLHDSEAKLPLKSSALSH